MRLSLICLGCWLAVSTVKPAAADQPEQLERTEVADSLVTAVHDVRGVGGSRYAALYITTKIEPEHWEFRRGPGRILGGLETERLLISAAPEVHREISDWLEKTRVRQKAVDRRRSADGLRPLSSMQSGRIDPLRPRVVDQEVGNAHDAAMKELAEIKQEIATLSRRMYTIRTWPIRQEEEEIAQTGFDPAPKNEKRRLMAVPYKVADLAAVHGDFAIAYQFDPIIRYIETNIAPEQWEASGGPGTMAPYRANLSLVISTTQEVHEQISNWLKDMRAAQKLLADFEKARFSEK